jgi:predicted Zn-dependent protease
MRRCAAFVVCLPLLAQEGAKVYSLQKELALGRQVAAEIRRQSKPLQNREVAGYATRIGSQLISHLSEPPRFPYSFEIVINAGMTEPISIPGGDVFIPAAFFLAAQNESEFAVMLAHAMGHDILRHGMRTQSRVETANPATFPPIFMGSVGSHADSRARIRPAMPLAFVKFQQSYELEADQFGIELAARAGYDAGAIRVYVERMQSPDSDMSPLPLRESRLAHIDESLSSIRVSPSRSIGQFERMQRAVREALGQLEQRRAPALRR